MQFHRRQLFSNYCGCWVCRKRLGGPAWTTRSEKKAQREAYKAELASRLDEMGSHEMARFVREAK